MNIGTNNLDLTSRVALFASLPNGLVIAEIGVARGHFSQHILTGAQPSCLYLIDHWREDSLADNPATIPQDHQEDCHREVCDKFKDVPAVRIIRKPSLEAVQGFASESLDVVYIDANHTDVTRDIVAWWPKVKRGGWLMGHDYVYQEGYFHVKPDVDAWVASVGLPLLLASVDQPADYPTWIVQKP